MNKIVYGMPTLIECDSLYDCVKLCKELNLEFIEINMNLPQYQKNTINIEAMKNVMKEENIFFTIHLDENLNVCDFNEEVSKAYLDTVMFAIEVAKELNIPVLNMHMSKGVYFTLPNEKVYLFERYKEIYLNKLLKFRNECEKNIGNSNIKICIENCDGYMDFMKEGVSLLLQSDVFKLTWDIGHDHSIGYKDSDFIIDNISKLKHMHIHDALGTKNHLPLGKGEINIANKLKIAEKNGCTCVLETKTIEGLKESVYYLIKKTGHNRFHMVTC